jgi:hypothetical protein
MATKREPKTVVVKLDHTNLAAARKKLPQASNSVDEFEIINLVQFLTPAERITFANELHRALKKGGRAQINAPHWCSARAFGDMEFQWPPVSETWIHHLNAEWRKANAPWGKRYRCDFDVSGGYGLHPAVAARNQEYQMHAISFFKEAAQDLVFTLIKR